jgi:hypothetical protein
VDVPHLVLPCPICLGVEYNISLVVLNWTVLGLLTLVLPLVLSLGLALMLALVLSLVLSLVLALVLALVLSLVRSLVLTWTLVVMVALWCVITVVDLLGTVVVLASPSASASTSTTLVLVEGLSLVSSSAKFRILVVTRVVWVVVVLAHSYVANFRYDIIPVETSPAAFQETGWEVHCQRLFLNFVSDVLHAVEEFIEVDVFEFCCQATHFQVTLDCSINLMQDHHEPITVLYEVWFNVMLSPYSVVVYHQQ